MKVLCGRKALITGGARGIGRALTIALARCGVDCYVLDIDEAGLAATITEARKHGVAALGRRCDLADPAAISRAVAAVLDAFGHVHLLINNAGVACYGATDEITAEQWQQVLAVNLLAPIQLTRELLPVLLAQEESHILNIGSLASVVASSKLAPYNVSKFGLLGLGESLRCEFGRSSLGVTALCPGFVDTEIFDRALFAGSSRKRKPARWLMTTPERVAQRAVRAIRRNEPLVVMTALARTVWLLKRIAPSWFLRAFCRRYKPSASQQQATQLRAQGVSQPDQRKAA